MANNLRVLLLSALLCVSPGKHLAFGQAIKPTPKANAVVIQTPDSAAVALRHLAQAFVAQGYAVDKLDTQFLTLTLAPKTLSGNYSPVITIRANASQGVNSTVRIMGDYRANAGAIQVAGRAQYVGSTTGTNKIAFSELQKAAFAYPSGKVSYAKTP
jgi:hypothetical protein